MGKFIQGIIVSVFVVFGLVIVGGIAVHTGIGAYEAINEFIITEFNTDNGVQE